MIAKTPDDEIPGRDRPRIVVMEGSMRPLGLKTFVKDTQGRVLNFTECCGGLIRLRIEVGDIKNQLEDVTQAETHAALQVLNELPADQRYDTHSIEFGTSTPPLITIRDSQGSLHEEGVEVILAYQNLTQERARKILMRLYRDQQMS